MSATTSAADLSEPGPDDPRVIAALEQYAAALKAGQAPAREEFQARHPDIAGALAECLEGLECMRGLSPAVASAVAAELQSGARSPSTGLQPGMPLGDYQIVREIGRGGMGVVYEAEQLSLRRRVALKVLPFAAALDTKQLLRFKNEAQAAAHLHHTNIVPVYGVGCARGVHFYAMQYIEGRTLVAVITERQQLAGGGRPADRTMPFYGDVRVPDVTPDTPGTTPGTERQPAPTSTQRSRSDPAYFRTVAELGIQAAEALQHAHQLGIIHRDIKPANLLVEHAPPGPGSSPLRLWITDFGLAQCQNQAGLSMTGDLVGTLRYMSPEQALAKPGTVDARTDIYSLGATLYELLTLQPAFSGNDRAELLRQIAFEEPTLPRRLNKAIPVELETIVLKAMDKDPGQRYATAQELVDDLQRFLQDRPIQARRPTLQQRLAKWVRRHKGIAWMGVALLAVVAVGSALSTLLIARQLARAEKAEEDRSIELQRAVRAEDDAKKNLDQARRALWQAKLAQAQAARRSGRAGQRFGSLEVLAEAARLARELGAPEEDLLKLRNEAIACLALPDLRFERTLLERVPQEYWIAFDPKFRFFAWSDLEGNIRIRRVADGTETARLPGPGALTKWVQLMFSPDGQWLEVEHEVPGRPLQHVFYQFREGKIDRRFEVEHHCEFSPDGRLIAGWRSDGAIGVYELPSGRFVKRLAVDKGADGVIFHPDGRQLLVWPKSDHRLFLVVDLETGKEIARYPHPQPLECPSWSGDGRLLAVGCGDQRIYVWDHAQQRLQSVLEGHTLLGNRTTFSHAGDFLISTSWDWSTRLWDPVSGRQLVCEPGSFFVAIRRDDRQLALLKDGRLTLWEVAGGWECRTLHHGLVGNQTPRPGRCGPTSVNVSPDGRLLASSSLDGVRLWDLAHFTEVGHLPLAPTANVLFHPNGESLFTYGPAGLHRWPIQRLRARDQAAGSSALTLSLSLRIGPPQALDVPGNWTYAGITTDRLGRRLAAVDFRGGRVIVLNIEEHSGPSGKPSSKKLVLDHAGVDSCQLSPDARWALTWAPPDPNGFSTNKVWDLTNGKAVSWNPPAEDEGGFFTPDGRWLVTSPPGNALCRCWQVGSWQPGPTLPKPSPVRAVLQPSPDGVLLCWRDYAHSPQKLLDARTGNVVGALEPPGEWESVSCFSPDGTRFVSVTLNHTIHVWDLRAIRRGLARIGLDWDHPAYPPAIVNRDTGPIRVEVRAGTSQGAPR